MAVTCPVCKCDFTQGLGDLYQCLGCSVHFDPADGSIHDTDTAETLVSSGPPPEVDPTGKYDHTGPYPTPVHATPPNPGVPGRETQADLDAAGEPVNPVDVPTPVEAQAAPEPPPAVLPDPDPSAQ